jgi:hypothetical protein
MRTRDEDVGWRNDKDVGQGRWTTRDKMMRMRANITVDSLISYIIVWWLYTTIYEISGQL